jgi:outer membrane lipoprotein-sorting protein
MPSRIEAALLLAALTHAVAPSRPPAAELLRAAMSAPAHVSYVGEVQVLRLGAQRSDAAVYRVEHLAPDMTRRWYLAPQALYGDSIISRGTQTYSIDVKRDVVVASQDDELNDQVTEDDNFGVLMANYAATYAPDQNIDGHMAHVVLLTNRYTGQITMRLLIDARTNLVIQRLQYAGNGSLISQTRIEQIRYTQSIPRGIFDLPKGVRTVQGTSRAVPSKDVAHVIAKAGFPASTPRYLPEGFTAIAADVISIKNIPTLHLLFSDGIRTVSFFQNNKDAAVDLSRYHATATTVGTKAAEYVDEGPTTLLAWSDGDRHYALVGELSLGELEKIAVSVLP